MSKYLVGSPKWKKEQAGLSQKEHPFHAKAKRYAKFSEANLDTVTRSELREAADAGISEKGYRALVATGLSHYSIMAGET